MLEAFKDELTNESDVLKTCDVGRLSVRGEISLSPLYS